MASELQIDKKMLTYILPSYEFKRRVPSTHLMLHDPRVVSGWKAGGILVYENLPVLTNEDLYLIDEEITAECGDFDQSNVFGSTVDVSNGARDIRSRVVAIEPPRVPKVAFEFGYDGYLGRKPDCRITCEHINELGSQYLMLLPKSKKKIQSVKLFVQCLLHFGIEVESTDLPGAIAREQPWTSTQRDSVEWFVLKKNCTDTVELLLSYIVYSVHMLDVMYDRIAVCHLFATIEGQPRFRDYWTSPPL